MSGQIPNQRWQLPGPQGRAPWRSDRRDPPGPCQSGVRPPPGSWAVPPSGRSTTVPGSASSHGFVSQAPCPPRRYRWRSSTTHRPPGSRPERCRAAGSPDRVVAGKAAGRVAEVFTTMTSPGSRMAGRSVKYRCSNLPSSGGPPSTARRPSTTPSFGGRGRLELGGQVEAVGIEPHRPAFPRPPPGIGPRGRSSRSCPAPRRLENADVT